MSSDYDLFVPIDPNGVGLRQGLTSYGDAHFSLFVSDFGVRRGPGGCNGCRLRASICCNLVDHNREKSINPGRPPPEAFQLYPNNTWALC